MNREVAIGRPRSAARDRIANCDFGQSIKASVAISGVQIFDTNEKSEDPSRGRRC